MTTYVDLTATSAVQQVVGLVDETAAYKSFVAAGRLNNLSLSGLPNSFSVEQEFTLPAHTVLQFSTSGQT